MRWSLLGGWLDFDNGQDAGEVAIWVQVEVGVDSLWIGRGSGSTTG